MVPVDAVGGTARARLGRWPYDGDTTQIVLLDHHMVPTVDAVRRWVDDAARMGPSRIRTGALFPAAAEVFHDAGFRQIDTLALLEAGLDDRRRRRVRRSEVSTRRLRPDDLADVARLDRAAFGDPWSNDEQALREIMSATPRRRARVVGETGIDGFAIAGQSARAGYLQRLAVHPHARRQGIARLLVTDALHWMRRRGATSALVNTAVDNAAALALYRSFGFERRPESLSILEFVPR